MNGIHEEQSLEGVYIDKEIYKIQQLNVELKKDNENNKEWRKFTFERNLKNMYNKKHLHDNDVNNISEWN